MDEFEKKKLMKEFGLFGLTHLQAVYILQIIQDERGKGRMAGYIDGFIDGANSRVLGIDK